MPLKYDVFENIMENGAFALLEQMLQGLYSKHVPIVPVLVESWPGQVNSGPW